MPHAGLCDRSGTLHPAARAEGVEAEIEPPFAALYQAGGILDRRECLPDLVRCAENGVRRDGRAAADHLCGMAGYLGLVVGDGRGPDALVRVVGHVEITLLRSSLKAD